MREEGSGLYNSSMNTNQTARSMLNPVHKLLRVRVGKGKQGWSHVSHVTMTPTCLQHYYNNRLLAMYSVQM